MVNPSQTESRKRLGQILVEGAFITQQELEAALEKARITGGKLGEILIEDRLLTRETLATILSFQLGVPIVELKQFRIQPEAIRLVPEDIARQNNVLPLAVQGDTLTMAMDEPQDIQLIDTLSALTRMQIRPVIPLHGGIREAVDSHYKLTAQIEQQARQVVTADQGRLAPEPLLAAEAITQVPVVRAVEMIITQAVKDRASDIHIEPEEDVLQVRYRIDGLLHDAVSLPLGVHAALLSRIKVMANMNIAERRRPQDGQFSMQLGEKPVDFRVATIEGRNGEMVVMRVLDKSASLFQLADIGLQPDVMEIYTHLLSSPFGMLLVSGPTGSGKTTTLYASLNQLDPKERNIMTIEDPIEYHFKRINQIQVNRAADIDFAAGLRALMRLDPDVMLVGEVRDAETANTAIQAALTGHLVLTSIHANDSVGAIVRLIDLGVEHFLVTSAIIAAVAQRLVRRVCTYCRVLMPAPPAEAMAYQQEMSEVRTDFYYGRGCNFCSHTGFLGRTGVYEVLPLSDEIRQLILRQASAADIKAQALREGMITMRRDGMIKARNGITTPSEVMRNVFTIG